MPQPGDKQQKREQVRQIVDRVKQDPSFRTQFDADPVATLQQAGLPENAIREILADDGYGEDGPKVRGKKLDTARPSDCWLTDCPCTKCCITSF